jgi:hypothetical protein
VLSVFILSVIMLCLLPSVVILCVYMPSGVNTSVNYAELCFAECSYGECRYTERRYADCRGAQRQSKYILAFYGSIYSQNI